MSDRAILGTLVARTAVHVGCGVASDTTDSPLRRDARGRHLIPGTAIAGSLRSLATRLAPRVRLPHAAQHCTALVPGRDPRRPCGCPVCTLFGSERPGDEEGGEGAGGHASRIWVYNAMLEEPRGGTTIRDQCGIDRSTRAGAAEAGAKFDLETLPAGSKFALRIEFDTAIGPDSEVLLAAVLAECCAGRLTLGGRAARGLGAFDLVDLRAVTIDLHQPKALMAFLRDTSTSPWIADYAQPDAAWFPDRLTEARAALSAVSTELHRAVLRTFVAFEFALQSDGLFLSHDVEEAGASGFDHATMVDPATDRPLLAGSSLRGVLRSQAERIARTVVSHRQPTLDGYLNVSPACDPLNNPINRPPAESPLASCDALLTASRKSAPAEDNGEAEPDELCWSCRLFGSTRLGSRLFVEDAPLDAAVEQADYKALDFLAIDRFTGGGREGAKFDAQALWKPRFSVRIHVENPEPWELGWLLLTLRDIHEGLAHVGFGAAKGFGRCRIENLQLTVGSLTDGDAQALGGRLPAPVDEPAGLFQERTLDVHDLSVPGGWSTTLEPWLGAWNAHTQTAQQRQRPKTSVDSYFGQTDDGLFLNELYPLRTTPRA
jgi:CRISPR/Cas system CSM-associated protein Csm3 (group 7 of RAMP superfamily)